MENGIGMKIILISWENFVTLNVSKPARRKLQEDDYYG